MNENIILLIKNLYEKEFASMLDKFEVFIFPVTNKPDHPEYFYQPGVYIFMKDNRPWKVGKHFDNSSKRAYQHFEDNTGDNIGMGMQQYMHDPTMQIMLINVKNKEDIHWVIALETFLEMQLRKDDRLVIKSARVG